MPLLPKEILKPGEYHTEEGVVVVTPRRLKHWAKQFKEMKKARLTVPIPWEHQDDAKPSTQADRLASRVKHNAGFLEDLWVAGDGSLWGLCDLPDEKTAERVKKQVRYVSPEIEDEFTDGTGRKWHDVFTHLALTPRPVWHAQKPFGTKVQLSQGGVMRLSLKTYQMAKKSPYSNGVEDFEEYGDSKAKMADSLGSSSDRQHFRSVAGQAGEGPAAAFGAQNPYQGKSKKLQNAYGKYQAFLGEVGDGRQRFRAAGKQLPDNLQSQAKEILKGLDPGEQKQLLQDLGTDDLGKHLSGMYAKAAFEPWSSPKPNVAGVIQQRTGKQVGEKFKGSRKEQAQALRQGREAAAAAGHPEAQERIARQQRFKEKTRVSPKQRAQAAREAREEAAAAGDPRAQQRIADRERFKQKTAKAKRAPAAKKEAPAAKKTSPKGGGQAQHLRDYQSRKKTEREGLLGTIQDSIKSLTAPGAKKAGKAAVTGLVKQLMGLTVAQMGSLKKGLGVKASGAKSVLAQKIAHRALGVTESKTPRAAATKKPKAAPVTRRAPAAARVTAPKARGKGKAAKGKGKGRGTARHNWKPYIGKRGARKGVKGWKDEATGRIVYGAKPRMSLGERFAMGGKRCMSEDDDLELLDKKDEVPDELAEDSQMSEGEDTPQTDEDYLAEAVKLLGEHDIHLPEHVSQESFIRDLCVALHALVKGGDDAPQMSEGDDDEDEDDLDAIREEMPSSMMMSMQKRVEKLEAQNSGLRAQQQLDRLKKFEREGRVSPADAKELRALIQRHRLSFVKPNNRNILILKTRLDQIARTPRGTFGGSRQQLSFGVSEASSRTPWDEDGVAAVKPERARKAAEEQLRNSGIRIHDPA